jgi:RNA polymerase sigma factor (sigma-70 family)
MIWAGNACYLFHLPLVTALMNSYSIYTDEELVHLIQANDATASKQAAEDLVHEVFTSLWARRAELPIQSLKAYLATAVKFAVFKAIARDKRRRMILKDLPFPAQFNEVEEKLEARFLQEYVNGVIEQLPNKARLVFTFSRAEDLNVKEIATKMELSPKAVEYHMTKALRALKEAIQKINYFFV